MLRALATISAKDLDSDRVIDAITLDLDARRKRRQTLTCERGTHLLVDLPAVPGLRDGDGFLLEDGRIVQVNAASEPLLEVRPSPADMARIAWHLGNRHLPVQFVDGAIRLRADHVIEAMLHKLGAATCHVQAPFDPEGGAYGHGHTHAHG
ncbi:MAG: urease accessory protein UreE [Rhizobiales bacterium]|nr:urease accessory protein UreE [Hyphomicrobiales bacterium]